MKPRHTLLPALIFFLLFSLFVPNLLHAEENQGQVAEGYMGHNYDDNDDMWSKLGRGLTNTFFGFLELGYQPMEMGRHQAWPIALLGGVPKGILYFVMREVVGVYEIVTFPLPIPENYAPIMEPEYVYPIYPEDSIN